MPREKLTPEMLEIVRRDVMTSLHEDASIEVSAAGLVSMTIDARFMISRVAITIPSLPAEDIARLEQAVLSCVNEGIRTMASRTGDRLARSVADVRGAPEP